MTTPTSGLSVLVEGHGHRNLGNAVQEIDRPVEGIDDPVPAGQVA